MGSCWRPGARLAGASGLLRHLRRVRGRDRIGPSSACTHGIAVWPLHVGTAVGVVACLISLASAMFVFRRRDGSDEGSLASQYRFLGLLGIGSSMFNLVLIVGEGTVVRFLHACG